MAAPKDAIHFRGSELPNQAVFRVDMWETPDALPYSTIVQKRTSKAPSWRRPSRSLPG